MEGALHLGTLLAVLIHFREDILGLLSRCCRGERDSLKYLGFLILGSVPIAVVGAFFAEGIEAALRSVRFTGGMLLLTAGFLVAADVALRKRRDFPLDLFRALSVGLAQAFSVFPGISRSGATVSVGVLLGLGAREAARFSFLLSIPSIAGAGLFATLGAEDICLQGTEILAIALGSLIAFLSGLFAIRVLLSFLYRGRLWPFAVYCVVIGIVALVIG